MLPLPASCISNLSENVVREVVTRRAAGDTLLGIARDLTARGVPTAQGHTTWYASTVRSVIRSRRGQAAQAIADEPGDECPPLGRLIRSARYARGLSQADVGAQACVSRWTVRRIETDEDAAPPAPLLAAVLEVVGASAAEAAAAIDDPTQRANVIRWMGAHSKVEAVAHAA